MVGSKSPLGITAELAAALGMVPGLRQKFLSGTNAKRQGKGNSERMRASLKGRDGTLSRMPESPAGSDPALQNTCSCS